MSITSSYKSSVLIPPIVAKLAASQFHPQKWYRGEFCRQFGYKPSLCKRQFVGALAMEKLFYVYGNNISH
jgi:hypothetical protein